MNSQSPQSQQADVDNRRPRKARSSIISIRSSSISNAYDIVDNDNVLIANNGDKQIDGQVKFGTMQSSMEDSNLKRNDHGSEFDPESTFDVESPVMNDNVNGTQPNTGTNTPTATLFPGSTARKLDGEFSDIEISSTTPVHGFKDEPKLIKTRARPIKLYEVRPTYIYGF